MNPEFAAHKLNEAGTKKAEEVKSLFDRLLDGLTCYSGFVPLSISPFVPDHRLPGRPALLPQGRYLSLVKTKLEEAFLFAQRAIESDPANQLPDVDSLIEKQKEIDATVRGWINYNFKHDVAPKPFTGVTTKIEGRDAALNVDLPPAPGHDPSNCLGCEVWGLLRRTTGSVHPSRITPEQLRSWSKGGTLTCRPLPEEKK